MISAGPHYLARIERGWAGENVCVLVDRSGDILLEHWFPNTVRAFKGSLSPSSYAQLQALAADQQLKNLAQSDLESPLVSDSTDVLAVAIFREDTIQNLLFANPKIRKNYSAAESLANWLKAEEKDRNLVLQRGAQPTRCNPVGAISPTPQVKMTNTTKPSTQILSDPKTPFIVQMSMEEIHDGKVQRTCFIVYSDRRYHMEKAKQTYLTNAENKVYEDLVNESQLSSLMVTLGKPEIAAMKTDRDRPQGAFQDAMLTRILIPRGDTVQELMFSDFFNVSGSLLQTGGATGLRYTVNDQERAIEPVRNWFKNEIAGSTSVSTKTANGCLPSK